MFWIEKVDSIGFRACGRGGLVERRKSSLRRFGKLQRDEEKILPICAVDVIEHLRVRRPGPQKGNGLAEGFHADIISGKPALYHSLGTLRRGFCATIHIATSFPFSCELWLSNAIEM